MDRTLGELLVPNFVDFLSRHGEVRIVDSEETRRVLAGFDCDSVSVCYLSRKDNKEHEGLRHMVLLNGLFIGFLEAYDEPGGVIYYGKIPEHEAANGVENVRLAYQEDHPNSKKVGRIDVWDIPFP